eukprot:COSAG06_NODE_16170_length_1017_cov_0.767974_1_plen_150_part_10
MAAVRSVARSRATESAPAKPSPCPPPAPQPAQMAEGLCTTTSPGAPGTCELAGSPCHQAAGGPPPPQLQDLSAIGKDRQLLIAAPKMQGNTPKPKHVDLHNKSSHVILRNLYEATPRPVHRTDYIGVTTDFGCGRMAANAGTRLQEKNKT